jgi:hypothetical protein
MRVQRLGKSAPVVPIFLEGIDDIGIVVPTKVESSDVLLYEAFRNVKFASQLGLHVSFLWRGDKAHQIQRRRARDSLRWTVHERAIQRIVQKRVAKGATVVVQWIPRERVVRIQQTLDNAVEIYFQTTLKKSFHGFKYRVEAFIEFSLLIPGRKYYAVKSMLTSFYDQVDNMRLLIALDEA